MLHVAVIDAVLTCTCVCTCSLHNSAYHTQQKLEAPPAPVYADEADDTSVSTTATAATSSTKSKVHALPLAYCTLST
jgi:hypothetical protein